MAIPTLSILGAGRLAQTLSHLWVKEKVFTIETVISRSLESSIQAAAFIGQGTPAVADLSMMGGSTEGHALINIRGHTLKPPAPDLWLIACPDSLIEQAAAWLLEQDLINEKSIVFHCSGALSSLALKFITSTCPQIASIHPMHSFANPLLSINAFANTYCGCEGQSQALDVLKPAFERIGATTFDLSPEHKSLCHAGSVVACNYLVTLMEISLQIFEAAGVERRTAQTMLYPLVSQTAHNTLQSSPSEALTGPIARADTELVVSQWRQLQKLDPDLGNLYQQLAKLTIPIAKTQHQQSERKLAQDYQQLLLEFDQ